MIKQDIFDVIIIGGGPAGLYASFYAGLREMKTKIIEAQPVLGGKINVYPEKMIWDVGGLGPVTGKQLMDQLIEQAMTFGPEVALNEKIESIAKNNDGLFVLMTEKGSVHYSRTVIVAIGSGIIQPKKLDMGAAPNFEKTNLHYKVEAVSHFRDKTVLISGGGNSAIDWANLLEPVARKVHLTYRKQALTGHESQVSEIMKGSIECHFNTTISRLIPDDGGVRIKAVELVHNETGEVFTVEVDEVLVNHGFDQDASLLNNSNLPIEMLDNFYIKGTPNCESTVDGLFGAGDIMKFDGKLYLIAGAFQDAANAVNRAKKFIDSSAADVAMVSSNHEAFKLRNEELVKEMLKK
ncbi:NAD(P)/FAD-dependent oxidoreductase [Bacillus sp. FJAT-27245]|uniref:NAD(P)/FAD-dependent oxidoreductase n=1 Tax=Bacillus sp. FJAT-27245 TaxID=1684144 RepID=UPI0006A7A04D|nr:NAD(P)/FAD-dependent oxidoreductase [Bacillus sp. FJAT-27245]